MLVVGFLAGATALSTLADWAPPVSAPPNCVAGNPGCDAPINVGGMMQYKSGILGLKNAVIENLTVSTGTPVVGQALIAQNIVTNAAGNVIGATVGWGNAGTSNFGGIYTSNLNTNLSFRSCRYANPYTNSCTCPTGYTPHQSWEWYIANTPAYADSGQNVGFVASYQCIGSGDLPVVSDGSNSGSPSIRAGTGTAILNTPTTVTFSSPMPTLNYAINTNIVGTTVPFRGGLNTFITDKTLSGFTYVLTESFNCNYNNEGTLDWTAISYQ